jgi:hypothetical protein
VAKVTALNVAVTANTSQFDRQMHRVRQQLKQTREAASMSGAAGFAGPLGGRVAGVVGMMGLGGPMMAVAAATSGLAAAMEASRRDAERGTANLNDIMATRLSIQDAARMRQVAQMSMGQGGTAGDAVGALAAFRSQDFDAQSKLINAGVTTAELATIAAGTDAEAIKAMVELSKSPRGLEIAKALGGKSGEFFGSLSRIADAGNIDRAMGAGTSGELAIRAAQDELARQSRVAGQDPNAPDFLAELLRRLGAAPNAFLEEQRDRRGGTRGRAEEYLAEIANNTRGPG